MNVAEFKRAIATLGFAPTHVKLPEPVRAHVEARDWAALDAAVAVETQPGGRIFERLRPLAEFSSIEFILSLRSSREFPDEDGIWHDDGSRVLAFSLSLTLQCETIEGGRLGIRRRDGTGETAILPTPPFGTMIVFATGQQGFEHCIHKVTAGERLIMAGWCS